MFIYPFSFLPKSTRQTEQTRQTLTTLLFTYLWGKKKWKNGLSRQAPVRYTVSYTVRQGKQVSFPNLTKTSPPPTSLTLPNLPQQHHLPHHPPPRVHITQAGKKTKKNKQRFLVISLDFQMGNCTVGCSVVEISTRVNGRGGSRRENRRGRQGFIFGGRELGSTTRRTTSEKSPRSFLF